MAVDVVQHQASARHLLVTSLFALGLLCHQTVAVDKFHLVSGPTVGSGRSSVGAGLHSTRGLLVDGKGPGAAAASSLFEQAFIATFGNQTSDELQQVLAQFSHLVRLVDQDAPLSNPARLAFLPELGSDTALQAMRAGVQLSAIDPNQPSAVLAALSRVSETLRSASPNQGYPATRRLLLGALIKLRLAAGGPLPPAVQPAVDDLLRILFRLHLDSVANRGVVQFFHISKSGGTNLCQAAEANGCASQGFDTRTNCLIRDFFDQPRWVTYTAHKYLQSRMSSRQALPWFVNFHTFRPPYTCAQRRAYLLREGLTFYANEYTNPPGAQTFSQMCPDFVNLIMFRHPNDRLRSQIGWVQKLYKEFYMEVDTQAAFLNRTTGFWERLMPAGVNNYYIRSLLGQRFFEFPVQYVTREHVGLARLATLQHDIVLTLEAMARNDLALRVGLGWSQALRSGTVRSSSELGDPVALPLDFESMLERNAPDVEVFDFARAAQALDTVLWNFATAAGLATPPVATPPPSLLAAAAGTGAAAAEPPAGGCGYVSLITPAAVADLQARLRDVQVPPKVVQVGGGSSSSGGSETQNGTDAEGGSGATAGTPPWTTSVVGTAGARGGSVSEGGRVAAGGAATDEAVRRPAVRGGSLPSSSSSSSSGKRGPSVVSISHRRSSSRHLLRLKGGVPVFGPRHQGGGGGGS